MAASLIATIWELLDGRKDVGNLILELIGHHGLSMVNVLDGSPIALHGFTRQLLVRLKIILDHALSHFVLRDLATTSASDIPLRKDFLYEITILLLQFANRIESPERIGTNDYVLQRGLLFSTFLAAFRVVCLCTSPLTFEEEDALRQKTATLCQTWESHQSLSEVENLVLYFLVPATLDQIQDRCGRFIIKKVACGRFDPDSYQQGRTPFCVHPTTPQYRADSLRSCQGYFQSALGNLDQGNWVEVFWTLHDVSWAVMDASVRARDDYPSRHVTSAIGDLRGAVLAMARDAKSGSRGETLSNYFADAIAHTYANTDVLLPASVMAADQRQSIATETSEFATYLAERDRTLSDQYRTAPSAQRNVAQALEERLDSAISDIQRTDSSASSSYDHRPTAPRTGQTFSHVRPPPHFPRRPENLSTSSTALNATRSLQTEPEEPWRNGQDHGWMQGAGYARQESSIHARSPPIAEETFPGPPPRSYDTQPVYNPYPSPTSARPQQYDVSSPTPTSSSTSPFPLAREGTFTPSSQQTRTPLSPRSEWSYPTLPLQHRSTPPPPLPSYPSYLPNSSAHAVDTGLQVVVDYQPPPGYPPQQTSPITQPLSATEPYARPLTAAPSISSKSSKDKSGGFFGFGRAGKRSSTTPKAPPVPEDLCFCFSAVGTSLLLWKRKSPDYIVKLDWPFHEGQKLNLRASSSYTPSEEANTISVKFVEGGNLLTAVVVTEGTLSKLLTYDPTGRRNELVIDRLTNAVPTALAVSRDDSKVAVCCGANVDLYRVVNGVASLLSPLRAHNKVNNTPTPGGNRRVQKVNFSVDSSYLVVATQEYDSSQRCLVYVSFWSCGPVPGSQAALLAELDPVYLSVGYGDDTGLTGIFCYVDPGGTHVNSRIFLTAATTKRYPSVLMVNREAQRHHITLTLNDYHVDAAAQASGSGSRCVFKSGKHELGTLDIRSGHSEPIANFGNDRKGLNIQQEAMAVAFPKEGFALAFWRGKNGELVLKQVDIAQKPATSSTMALKDVYLQVVSQM